MVQREKADLRTLFKKKRGLLDEHTALKASLQAQKNILVMPEWHAAKSVALYMALPDEARTDLLCLTALAQKKILYLPRIEPDMPGEMNFWACSDLKRLVKNRLGILEPDKACTEYRLDRPAPDLLVLPGLAFDSSGNRLGYGGGYYDRFLARHKDWSTPLVGLAFDCQLAASVPAAEHDVKVNVICTERGLIWT